MVEKTVLVDQLKAAVEENGLIGVTTDMWTANKRRHFVSLAVHYMDNGTLCARILTVSQFHEKKTGENIRISIETTCCKLGLPLTLLIDHCYFVMDNGSNIKCALATFKRLPCACHMLALVVKHTLQPQSQVVESDHGLDFVEKIQRIVTDVKAIVAYCKRSELKKQLTSSLRHIKDTKWNSVLHMLSSVLEAKDRLWKLLSDGQPAKNFHDIDWSAVQALIEFLQPFDDTTKQLEGDRYPTLHRVYQQFCKLKCLMTLSSNDSEPLKYLKRKDCSIYFRKFVFLTYIVLYVFLTPNSKD